MGVGVQHVVGELCKHVYVLLAVRMVLGAHLGRARIHSLAMGAALPTMSSSVANFCGRIFGLTTCIFFANKWRILSKFSCFAMEGSQQRLKRMLRRNRGLTLLRGRLGVQPVEDNHTIDDSLAVHGWDATKRAQNGQGPMSVQRSATRTRR